MNHNFPEKLEDFVSSSDDLLKQFERIDIIDYIFCRIYNDTGSLAFYLSVRDRIVQLIQDSKYIWHLDPISFLIIYDDSSVCKSSTFHIQGYGQIGECIEDEWFLVFILNE